MAAVRRGLSVPTEEQEQRWLAEYLDALGLVWWHTPNGGQRDVRVARKLAGQGVKPGVPDVVIVSRPPLRPDARGVAIELKRREGGVVSALQRQMIQRLEGEGWLCLISKGWEMAAEWLARECGWGGYPGGARGSGINPSHFERVSEGVRSRGSVHR